MSDQAQAKAKLRWQRRVVPAKLIGTLRAPDGGDGADVSTLFDFAAGRRSRGCGGVRDLFTFDDATGRFVFDFVEFDEAYGESVKSEMRATTEFVVPPTQPKRRLELQLQVGVVEEWGINWAATVKVTTDDKRPRRLFLPGELTYDPAGITGDAHASERIGKACACTQLAITGAMLCAAQEGATYAQLQQIQAATEPIIATYHGRLTLWRCVPHQP